MNKKLFLIAVVGITLLLGIFLVAMNSKPATPQSSVREEATQAATLAPTDSTASPSASPSKSTSPSATSVATSSSVKATRAVIRTNKGTIELELFQKEAPNTVANFARKAKDGFYNNLTFHRVEDWVIQGGDPQGTGAGGGEMPTELNDKPFVVGALGAARRGDIRFSNDAQFFIAKQNAMWLDKQYTNFGIVTKGIEVVNKIEIGDKILGITVE